MNHDDFEWNPLEGFEWEAPIAMDGKDLEVIGPAEAADNFRQKVRVGDDVFYVYFTTRKPGVVVFYDIVKVVVE